MKHTRALSPIMGKGMASGSIISRSLIYDAGLLRIYPPCVPRKVETKPFAFNGMMIWLNYGR